MYSQALKEMCIIEEGAFKKRKTLHENYLGAVQLSCRNSACEFQLRSDYNSLLCDLIMSIRSHKKLIRDYSSRGIPLAAHGSGMSGGMGSFVRGDIGLNGTAAEAHAELDTRPSLPPPGIVFYITQILHTPMGPGEVSDINTDTETLTIRLPFGVMYAIFPIVATWLDSPLLNPLAQTEAAPQADFHHPANIQARWTDPHQASVGVDIRRQLQIRQILSPPTPVPTEEATSTCPGNALDKQQQSPTPSKTTRRRGSGGGGSKSKKGRTSNGHKQPPAPTPVPSIENSPKLSGHNSVTLATTKDDSDRKSETYSYLDPAPLVRHLFVEPGDCVCMWVVCRAVHALTPGRRCIGANGMSMIFIRSIAIMKSLFLSTVPRQCMCLPLILYM